MNRSMIAAAPIALAVLLALAAFLKVSGADEDEPQRPGPEAPTAEVEAEEPPATPKPSVAELQEAARQRAKAGKTDKLGTLRARIAANPDDLDAREALITELWRKRDDDSIAERNAHVLWLLRHDPGRAFLSTPYGQIHKAQDPESYAEAAAILLAHVRAEGTDPAVLETAASFFTLDDRTNALAAYLRLEDLAPEDARWPSKRAHTLMLDYKPGEDGPENVAGAAEALEAYQRAIDLSRDERRTQTLLAEAASAAAKAGMFDLAERYARTALSSDSDDPMLGKSLHTAHQALGLAMLGRGNLDGASAELIAMGAGQAGPAMRSFGPSMMLADRLLAAGGHDAVVLEYLEACRNFWPKPKLDAWIAAVKAGERPEFGANLRY